MFRGSVICLASRWEVLGYNSCQRKDAGLVVCGVVDFVELFCPADGDSRLSVCLSVSLLHRLASLTDVVTGRALI